MPPPLRRSGSGLLQNPWPGLLSSPKSAGLGPLGPSRVVLSTRQSSRLLRPAASLLLASAPGSRPTPEVDFRAPLAACPGGTHTRRSFGPLLGAPLFEPPRPSQKAIGRPEHQVLKELSGRLRERRQRPWFRPERSILDTMRTAVTTSCQRKSRPLNNPAKAGGGHDRDNEASQDRIVNKFRNPTAWRGRCRRDHLPGIFLKAPRVGNPTVIVRAYGKDPLVGRVKGHTVDLARQCSR